MEETDFINQGSKLQKLDYSQLVFLQINRLGCLATTYYSGQDTKTIQIMSQYAEQNQKLGLGFLESLIVFQLNDAEQQKYIVEKNSLEEIYSDLDKTKIPEPNQWFSLLMKYLAKSGIMPAKRRTLETLEE